MISAPAKGEARSLLWFDAPTEPWRPAAPPPPFAGRVAPEIHDLAWPIHWHYVEETDTWFGLDELQAERPVVYPKPMVWAARLCDGSGRFALWAGTWDGDGGEPYYLWAP